MLYMTLVTYIPGLLCLLLSYPTAILEFLGFQPIYSRSATDCNEDQFCTIGSRSQYRGLGRQFDRLAY